MRREGDLVMGSMENAMMERYDAYEDSVKASYVVDISKGISILKHMIESGPCTMAFSQDDITAISAFVRASENVVDRANEWCDAVDRDASWDGWDHHFKEMRYVLLPPINGVEK
jgi:hypothetical protein